MLNTLPVVVLGDNRISTLARSRAPDLLRVHPATLFVAQSGQIWFSILARRPLKRASFTSLEDLRTRVLDFISYFNDVLGKPFRWTYTGRPLQA